MAANLLPAVARDEPIAQPCPRRQRPPSRQEDPGAPAVRQHAAIEVRFQPPPAQGDGGFTGLARRSPMLTIFGTTGGPYFPSTTNVMGL
jgi:hypothetical protein